VAIVGVVEDHVPLDATGDDVMHGIGCIESRTAGHETSGSKRIAKHRTDDWPTQMWCL
jgi:hypothetical protein